MSSKLRDVAVDRAIEGRPRIDNQPIGAAAGREVNGVL